MVVVTRIAACIASVKFKDPTLPSLLIQNICGYIKNDNSIIIHTSDNVNYELTLPCTVEIWGK